MKMKKLLVARAAIVLGVSAQAALLAWGGYISNGLDANQTAQEGTVFNLVYLGSTDLSSSLGDLYFDTRTGLVGTGEGASWTAAAGQTLVDTHTLNADEAINYAFMKTFERADAAGGVLFRHLVSVHLCQLQYRFAVWGAVAGGAYRFAYGACAVGIVAVVVGAGGVSGGVSGCHPLQRGAVCVVLRHPFVVADLLWCFAAKGAGVCHTVS